MRIINQETWPRKDHFQIYNGMEFPHIGICVPIDITEPWKSRSRIGTSPTIALVYLITKAANRIPEMRQRIREGEVVEHDLVHAILAVLGEDDTFGVCTLSYDANFENFAQAAEKIVKKAKQKPSMIDFHIGPGGKIKRDDLLDITVLPWLAFTSFDLTRVPQYDSVPLLAWGKVIEEGEKFSLPFFVNFHHALVDGLHVSRFVQYVEEEAYEFAARYK
jgi:chloramphenicol O-acetyltransferase